MAGALTSPDGRARSQLASGLLYGFAAYFVWGGFPLYFALLDDVSPVEVVAHRIIWSLLFLAIVLTAMRGWRELRAAMSARVLTLLGAGALALSLNWGTYVWAVQANQVVEGSLGYFINPLVSVALGVLFLGEQLRRAQWAAVAIATLAVLVLSVAMGRPPWVSLILALSFGLYGLLKKQADVGAVQSLTIETALLFPVAAATIAVLAVNGTWSVGTGGPGIATLLVLLGPVTAIPLIAFGAAATRIPLSTLGLMQYFTPTVQFAIGLLVFDEQMTTGRWIGFGLVWIALVVFTYDTLRAARSTAVPRLAVAEPD